MTFRSFYTDVQRVRMSSRLRLKYPDRIPIVLEPYQKEELYRRILVPKTVTGGHLYGLVRSRLEMRPEEAIFVFCDDNNRLVSQQETVGKIYEDHRNEDDGFLYLHYALENTFGDNNAVSRIGSAMKREDLSTE